MGRHLLAAVVVVVDATLVAAQPGLLPSWGAPVYVLAVALTVGLAYRSPLGSFAAALLVASLTGGGHILLIWSAYQAGRAIASRADATVVVGAVLGAAAGQLTVRFGQPSAIFNVLLTLLVFVVLPMLVARYLTQHERLVSALDQRNRQLRFERELLGEQERLRERLRIARDMHDSLGHRLSLVSVQAAALEVSTLPAPHRAAVGQLARTTRDALDELYALVGTLREEAGTTGPAPGPEAIDSLVTDARSAGVAVTLRRQGAVRPLPGPAGAAAFRLVEEGLTNAVNHAPGQPVTVRLAWEPDALLLTVANPVPPEPPAAPEPDGGKKVGGPKVGDPKGSGPTGSGPGGRGHGLVGLAERVGQAGGFLDHRCVDGEFRLIAMLPTAGGAPDDEIEAAGGSRKLRTLVLGFATAVLMFAVLPVGILLGVR
nr:histidine kinase [Micromonospora sp. DSM 115978]